MRRKNFEWGVGKYYFTIKTQPNNITIYRKSKEAALLACQHYIELGKEVEWLGRWDGKKFIDLSVGIALGA